MDYYFGSQLRQTFGFDNPNHAGSFIASLLPWVLYFRTLFSFKSLCGRAIHIILYVSFSLGVYLMAQTLSRGGAIGLIGGLFFLGFHDWRQSLQKIDRRSFASHYGMVAVILISVFMMSGLLKRTENIHEDRSVSNRVVLWMSSARMIAENWAGLGDGESGRIYCDWYQDHDQNQKYRTLVNSPLTFMAEQGVLSFIFSGLIFLGLFCFISENQKKSIETSLIFIQTALIITGIASCFSSTLENPIILSFFLFLCCAVIFLSIISDLKFNFRSWIVLSLLFLLSVSGYLIYGKILSVRAGDKIQIDQNRIRYFPSQVIKKVPPIWIPIETVNEGGFSGKLIRKLSKSTGSIIECSEEILPGAIALTRGKFESTLDSKTIKWLVVDPTSRNLSRENEETKDEKYFYLIHEYFREDWIGIPHTYFYSNNSELIKILADLITLL